MEHVGLVQTSHHDHGLATFPPCRRRPRPRFTQTTLSTQHLTTYSRQRPYHVENTGSRPITEVKQRWARLVLGWVTAWEHRVLLSSLFSTVQWGGCNLSDMNLGPGHIHFGSEAPRPVLGNTS